MKEILAPRLQALEGRQPIAQPQVDVHDHTTIDAICPSNRVRGSMAAATIAPAIALLVVAVGNFIAPLIARLGLRSIFLENGISNLAIVIALGAWLFSWVALYDFLHVRAVSKRSLYVFTTAILLVAAVLFVPFVYRLAE